MNMFSLHQQLQKLQQEINDITQVCSQLQQSEQSHAIQLQQMSQKEAMATQGLRRIQQAASQLSQDVNQISSMTQQITSPIPSMPSSSYIPGTYGTFAGLSEPQFGTGTLNSNIYRNIAPTSTIMSPSSTYGALSSQTPLFSQGYSPNLFSTGTQMGYSSQALLNPGTISSSALSPNLGLSAGMNSPMMQTAGMSTSFIPNSLGSSSSLANTNLSSFSPYQTSMYTTR